MEKGGDGTCVVPALAPSKNLAITIGGLIHGPAQTLTNVGNKLRSLLVEAL